MIGFIKGKIEDIYDDHILIDNNGIGYEVFVPADVISTIDTEMDVKLYTYLQVREDAFCLFGFLTREDLDVFKKLITVNSVGPKSALSILSTMTTQGLIMAIVSGDAKAIAKSPGIGSKGASKIILELKDKFDSDNVLDILQGENYSAQKNDNKNITDAIETLTVLGYTNQVATKAVSKVEVTDDMDAGDIVSLALKHI